MIRRYSRPRHLTAGCNRPREPVATNDNGLTTAPSPPLSVNAVHHPVAAALLAGSTRSRHQQTTLGIDEAADRVHVPHVILVRVHGALGRHHVKRGDADIAKRVDPPTVVPIGLSEPLGKVLPDFVLLQ